MTEMIGKIAEKVCLLLNNNTSGHDMTHVERVTEMSRKFAEKEDANMTITVITALLHDVDDRKLVGENNADLLLNARRIMLECDVPDIIKLEVLENLKTIGYSKRLQGIMPVSIEAKVVSDADMCDGIGMTGIIRTALYGASIGRKFFDKNIFPMYDIDHETYVSDHESTSICMFFEKLLLLRDMMLTGAGRTEAFTRHDSMIRFLQAFFLEQNCPEWLDILADFQKKQFIDRYGVSPENSEVKCY